MCWRATLTQLCCDEGTRPLGTIVSLRSFQGSTLNYKISICDDRLWGLLMLPRRSLPRGSLPPGSHANCVNVAVICAPVATHFNSIRLYLWRTNCFKGIAHVIRSVWGIRYRHFIVWLVTADARSGPTKLLVLFRRLPLVIRRVLRAADWRVPSDAVSLYIWHILRYKTMVMFICLSVGIQNHFN